jgi:hypothetical protein
VTPAEVITEVRSILQDADTPYRYSDTDLLGFVNQTIKRMVVLRPDLFGVIGDIPTTAGSAVQSLPSDALRLIDIFQVKGGNAVTEVDRETMARYAPDWMNATAGSPVNFMRHVKNSERFFLYPPPTAGTVLVGEYAQVPADYALTDTITTPSDAFFPTIIDGTVWLAESIEDEAVNSKRAEFFLQLFTSQLSASLQSRTVTDTKPAGMKPSRTDQIIGEVI